MGRASGWVATRFHRRLRQNLYRPIHDFLNRLLDPDRRREPFGGSGGGVRVAMRLDISIGPVQGFVSQSRRTRDLWSSSYLLSFLVAHAMHGAQSAGGRVIQPRVADDLLYRWATARRGRRGSPAGYSAEPLCGGGGGCAVGCGKGFPGEFGLRVVQGVRCGLGRVREAHRRPRQRHGGHLAPSGERILGISLDRGCVRRTGRFAGPAQALAQPSSFRRGRRQVHAGP